MAEAQVPGSLVPGRQEPQQAPITPKSVPGTIAPAVPAQQQPENSKEITFVLQQINLEGVQTLDPHVLAKIWEPYIGKTISLSTVYDIAQKITQRYADAGYVLSFAFIPEQEINDGVVTIRVIEGFVERVVIDRATSQKLFERGFGGNKVNKIVDKLTQKITASRPLTSRDLERYLLLLNEYPGLKVQATFSASPDTVGASVITIKTSHKMMAANLSTDNQMASTLGRWNVGGSVSINGVLTGGDSVQLAQRCGFSCSVYHSSTTAWSTFIGTEGLKLSATFAHSEEEPKTGVLVPLLFKGQEKGLILDITYPVILSRQKNLNIGSTFSWSNNMTQTFAGTLTQDHVRTLGLFASYDWIDKMLGATVARFDITQGLPMLDATGDTDPLRSRAGGSSQFTNLGLFVARNQPLGALSPKFNAYSLYASTRAQAAVTDPLLSVSQCFYGGGEFGRGYDSGAISGDSCLMGGLELRRDIVLDGLPSNAGMQIYGFSDAGAVWRKGNALAAGESKTEGAQSYGAGLRLGIGDSFQGRFEAAWPVRAAVTDNGKITPRLQLNFSWRY